MTHRPFYTLIRLDKDYSLIVSYKELYRIQYEVKMAFSRTLEKKLIATLVYWWKRIWG